MPRSMRYIDCRGRRQTFTFSQWVYLSAAESRGRLEQGWGGLSNRFPVLLMEERGLCTVSAPLHSPWRITGVTKLGRELLDRWREREEREREPEPPDFVTGAENPFEDDGRRWWFLGAKLWSGIHMYQARNARAALASYRADLFDAETMNGHSKRETRAYLSAAELGVVQGPVNTRQAFEIELGLALAEEIVSGGIRSGRDVAMGPATLADCDPWVDQHRIDVIYHAVIRRFVNEDRDDA